MVRRCRPKFAPACMRWASCTGTTAGISIPERQQAVLSGAHAGRTSPMAMLAGVDRSLPSIRLSRDPPGLGGAITLRPGTLRSASPPLPAVSPRGCPMPGRTDARTVPAPRRAFQLYGHPPVSAAACDRSLERRRTLKLPSGCRHLETAAGPVTLCLWDGTHR